MYPKVERLFRTDIATIKNFCRLGACRRALEGTRVPCIRSLPSIHAFMEGMVGSLLCAGGCSAPRPIFDRIHRSINPSPHSATGAPDVHRRDREAVPHRIRLRKGGAEPADDPEQHAAALRPRRRRPPVRCAALRFIGWRIGVGGRRRALEKSPTRSGDRSPYDPLIKPTSIHNDSPVCARKHVLMMEFLHGQRLDKALRVSHSSVTSSNTYT